MATVAPYTGAPRIDVARPLSGRTRRLAPLGATTTEPEARYAPPVLRALEALDLAVGLYGRGGLRHASRGLDALLHGADGDALGAELERVAQLSWGVANVRGLRDGVEPLDGRVVALGRGPYRVSACFVGQSQFESGPYVLLSVDAPRPDPFAPDRLRALFGLTRKQCVVARLLVDGLRNDEIARRLFISPHTARHHTEQIKLKLGAETRTAVAARILAF